MSMKALLRFLIILAIGAIAGIPFMVGLSLEAWFVAQVFQWDWETVFYVQAILVLILGGLGVLFAAFTAAMGEPMGETRWPDWLAPRAERER